MHYMGFPPKFDEWILFNPKMAKNPRNRITKIAVRWNKTLKAERSLRRYAEDITKGNPWEEVFPGVLTKELKEEESEKSKRDKSEGSSKETNFAGKYGEELKQLQAMGFTNFDKNIAALMASHGDVQGAIVRLLAP